VEAYCVERLFPGTHSIGFEEMFADYRDWCEGQKCAPEDRPGFDAALRELASPLAIAVSAEALSGVRLGCAPPSTQRRN
jgi:hypothetical protein